MNLKLTAGLLACITLGSVAQAAVVDIYPDSIKAGETKTWTADNRYIMHGKIIVKGGARLNIQAGTVVCGCAESGPGTADLIVSRGSRIYATGTATKPIIFTSVWDTAAWDSKAKPLALTNDNRGLWGAIQIYGRAPTTIAGGVGNVKGDGVLTLTDTSVIRYGDSTNANPYDTSGVLQYVSVRYTGISDVDVPKVEFNGVGKGTIIDHFENVMAVEDGIAVYGGTVDMKHVISAFHAGDGLYCEQGYSGRIQYWFGEQNFVDGNPVNGAMVKVEGKDKTSLKPLTNPKFYNVTFIGTGKDSADTWKYKYGVNIISNGTLVLENSIMTQFHNYGIQVETTDKNGNPDPDSLSSQHWLDAGLTVIKNNIWYGFGRGNTVDSIAMGLPKLQGYLKADSNHNTFADPNLGGFSWGYNGKLDPRPSATGPATQNVATVPNDGFFEQTTYRGAFEPGKPTWAAGWSFLATSGILTADASTPVVKNDNSVKTTKSNLMIAGSGLTRSISWNQSNADNVTISLHSVDGKQIAVLSNGYMAAGKQNINVSLKGISSGLYVMHFKTGNQIETRLLGKM